jgi:hypothetical protein
MTSFLFFFDAIKSPCDCLKTKNRKWTSILLMPIFLPLFFTFARGNHDTIYDISKKRESAIILFFYEVSFYEVQTFFFRSLLRFDCLPEGKQKEMIDKLERKVDNFRDKTHDSFKLIC